MDIPACYVGIEVVVDTIWEGLLSKPACLVDEVLYVGNAGVESRG